MRWPIGIAIVLFIVIVVQVAFAIIAVRTADEVDPTYASEAR